MYPKFATWLGSSCSNYNQERGRTVPFSGVETVNKIPETISYLEREMVAMAMDGITMKTRCKHENSAHNYINGKTYNIVLQECKNWREKAQSSQ